MSTVATPPRAATRPHDQPERTFADRLLSAVPLASVYLWLCVVYGIEAGRRATPWLFGDELEFTQLSRAIADTGHPARRGVAHAADSLYVYLVAPLWWINDTSVAYEAVKYTGVLVMTAALFPTYFLARLVVGKWPALFAATGAAAIPALAYSSWIVEEPLAYPYAALAFFVLAKALVTRSRWWIAATVLVYLVAPAVRGELAVLPATALLALLFMAWSSPWARARRASWSVGDWVGTVTLVFGAVFLVSGILSHRSYQWYSATVYGWTRDRVLDYGLWAAGAFAIGIGVIPLVLGLATLWRLPGERPTRELRTFRSVAVAAFICFGMYTAIKAAYISMVFETRVEERNIIYVAPLLFVGTAIWLERRRVNPLALAAATAFAVYLVVGTPYQMGVQLYSDALGLAILQQGNRFLYWTPTFAHWLLLSITLVGAAVVFAMRFVPRRIVLVVAAALGALIVGWNLTGAIAASTGTNSIARTAADNVGRPLDWVDRVAHRQPTIYLGQAVADQNAEWTMEFWNRSIVAVGSFDGSIGGPGPAGGPNFKEDGTTYWTNDPNDLGQVYSYAVEDAPCVDYAGTQVAQRSYAAGGDPRGGDWRLIKLTSPNRMRSMCVGISPDGWTGPMDSAYYRFSGGARGHMVVTVSRARWGGPSARSPVHVYVGTLKINDNHQPELQKVTAVKTVTIDRLETKQVTLPAPGPRFAVRVVVDQKFVPHDLDPTKSDTRQLGAGVSYRFVPDAATK